PLPILQLPLPMPLQLPPQSSTWTRTVSPRRTPPTQMESTSLQSPSTIQRPLMPPASRSETILTLTLTHHRLPSSSTSALSSSFPQLLPLPSPLSLLSYKLI